MNLGVSTSIATAFLLAFLNVYVYWHRPPPPLRPALELFLLAALTFVVGTLLSTVFLEGAVYIVGIDLLYTGIITMPVLWWFVALRFSEVHGRPFAWASRPWVRAPVVIASILWLALVTNPWHQQFLTPVPGGRSSFHWLWWVNAGHGYGLFGVVLVLFSVQAWKSTSLTFRKQMLVLLSGTAATLGSNGLYVLWPASPPFDFTVVGMGVASTLFIVGIYWTRLFSLLPAALPEIIRHDPDAVVLLDGEGFLLYANPSAQRLFATGTIDPGQLFFPLLATYLTADESGAVLMAADALAQRLTSPSQPSGGHLYRFGSDAERWLRVDVTTIPGRRGRVRARSLRFHDLTALKDATEMAAQQGVILNATMESSGEGILVCDIVGKILYSNRALRQILSLPDAELKRGSYTDALRNVVDQLAGPPAAVAQARALLENPDSIPPSDRTSRAGLLGERTEEFSFCDGRILERTGYPLVRDGEVVGRVWKFLDVTQERRAEEALRDSEVRHRLLYTEALDCIFTLDMEARLVAGNPALEKTTGHAAEDWAAMSSFFDVILPESVEEIRSVYEKLIRGETVVGVEYAIRRKDGASLYLSASLRPVLQDGSVVRIEGIARDVTERRRDEEERRKLEAQLQHAQKLESLGVLAGGIAHDFNNLLTGILGSADLAFLDLPPESPVRDQVEGIRSSALHAAQLTQQMLAYSGKGQFVIEPVDLGRLVGEITHLLNASIPKNVVLEYDFAPDRPMIEADAAQIQQVIMNLIINAGEAIEDRRGVVTVSTGVVVADQAYLADAYLGDDLAPGDYAFLEVSDTGVGMDAETIDKIFEPFFTTKFQGRGLGLAAVLGIVRGHRGALEVSSELGCGTTFRVLLPAVAKPAVARLDGDAKVTEWRGSGTILVVDDEESVRRTTRQMLLRGGFQVLTAEDGERGVEVFRAHADEIVLVLLDMTMPHLDGEGALREIRCIRPDARVILSSGYNEVEVTKRFAGKSLAGFLQKPYRLETLERVVRAALEA